MELHSHDRKLPVSEPHDLSLRSVLVESPCTGFEAGGNRFRIHDQGVITGRPDRARQHIKHTVAVVVDHGRFTVHHLARMNNPPAKSLRDALVAQAHAEDRYGL